MQFDCTVVGGGVIGLAVGRALALRGLNALVLEGERHFGSWTSSRNSEVIHAGIYYPPSSLKAVTCVEGRDSLYAFCRARHIPHRRCGKLIVAMDRPQSRDLNGLYETAARNGVYDLRWLDARQVARMEPGIAPTAAALFSPSTGILDVHAYMLALIGEAEANGATLALGAKVRAVRPVAEGWSIWIEGEDEAVVTTTTLVNAAGLAAQALAGMVDGFDKRHVPARHLAKGVYFTYSGKTSFRHLVYPVPQPGGLGIHLTLDLAGQARFGPDVEWVGEVDYRVDESRRDDFARAIQAYWPKLDPSRLVPGYAGVRPKLSGPGEPNGDFVISDESGRGARGLINLYGIESPGVTASLALAELVAAKVQIVL